MKKIYIAGKISGEVGTPELMSKCVKKFNDYGYSLLEGGTFKDGLQFIQEKSGGKAFIHGFIINHSLIASGNGTWEQYMRNDIKALMECNEIHLLPDWRDSVGAKLEHQIADALGMKIVYVLG